MAIFLFEYNSVGFSDIITLLGLFFIIATIIYILVTVNNLHSSPSQTVLYNTETNKSIQKTPITYIVEMKIRKEAERILSERTLTKWQEFHKKNSFSSIDKLNGREFEKLLEKYFIKKEYKNVKRTSHTGDQGIDILFEDEYGYLVGVQAKRHSQPVGNSVIQELLGGMLYYGCKKGIVITNSSFTKSGILLSEKDSRITLWDREKFQVEFGKVFPEKFPIYTYEEAKKLGIAETKLSRADKEMIYEKFGLKYDGNDVFQSNT